MSQLHKQAMDAVLTVADLDIEASLKEGDVTDPNSEEADDVIFDVAILHAYRVFTRICEKHGLQTDAGFFAELAADLADDDEM